MTDVRLRITDGFGDIRDDPDATQLEALFAGMNLRSRFLIVERLDGTDDTQTYLQLALNDDLTMVMEYRDGGPEAHYRAEVPLPAEMGGDEIVMPVLLGWGPRRPGWRGDLTWVRWDVSTEAPWEEHRD
ncbi:hypothetical protein AB0912_07920 [Streptomyces sp. NPDC007084]|uniref:hypothetical protein n=1 Tax=Streptomyces sp. NPDC007084 TaxID=3154313 RepID=UPI003452B497